MKAMLIPLAIILVVYPLLVIYGITMQILFR